MREHWILRSNKYFDTWGNYKFLFLVGLILISGALDALVFKSNHMLGYAIILLPFTIWRMFGVYWNTFKKCDHTKNYRMRKYLTPDGTPMIEFDCNDCEFSDHGHVYGDNEDWVEFKLVQNGEIVHHTKGDKILVE